VLGDATSPAARGDPGSARERRRVLAIASGGGHWKQLLRIRASFAGHDVAFATTGESYRTDVHGARFYVFRDASRWDKLGLLRLAWQVFRILRAERPEVIVTTGAAAGYFALRFGKWMGARTLWLDSIANAEELSLSGKKCRRYADLWLTQWPHLAQPAGPFYRGDVL
jgi:hypothetical protein